MCLSYFCFSPPLTTYIIRTLHISEFTSFCTVDSSKFYSKSCSFQSLQKASMCTKTIGIKHSYYLRFSFQFLYDPANFLTQYLPPYVVAYLVKVFVIATPVHIHCEMLSFYIYIWCTQPFFNKLKAEQEGQEALNLSPEYTGQKSNI